LFHAGGYGIGDAAVETGTVVDDVDEFVVDIGWQVFIHLLTIEYILAEVFGGALRGGADLYGLLLECLFDDLKSEVT
jgi:hypothetical protein